MTITTLILCLLSASSQSDVLAELAELYYEGYYDSVIRKAGELLDGDSGADKQISIELHRYKGYSYVALGENDKAKKEFRSMLELDPTLSLDPLKVSPKIVQVFDEARDENPATFTLYPKDSLRVKIPSDSSGPESTLSFRKAVLFSTLLPGSGQLYSGNRFMGWGFVACEGLSIAGLVVSHVCMNKAREEYVNATEPDEIEAKYRIYNNWYVARNALGGLSVGIWISAPLELVFFPPKWAKKR